MIKKIIKINNLGIFSDYKWDNQDLPDFKQYNLFYGWNGSGKTTLTKLFSALEKGLLHDFPSLEYEIESETGSFKNNQVFNKKVRVFNQDYITNHIEIIGSKAKPILILGEENKVILEQIIKDENSLNESQDRKKEQEELKARKEAEKGRKFTDVAKIIGTNIKGELSRNYRKPEAERAFRLLLKKELLGEHDVSKYLIDLKQEEKPTIDEMILPDLSQKLNLITQKSKELCLQIVESLVIERLKNNIDISQWVESGLALHLRHTAKKCEFCNQHLSEERIQELMNYFNEEDQKLKKSLDINILQLKEIYKIIESLCIIDKANFYTEFQQEYTQRCELFSSNKANLLEHIFDLIKILEAKKNKTMKHVNLEFEVVTNNEFEKSMMDINKTIQSHNKKTANFQERKEEALKKLENHYISEIFDEVREIKNTINDCDIEIKKLNSGDEQTASIPKLKQRIIENKAIISSEHKGCADLNRNLEIFLGRKEIIFEVSPSGGYVIKRNGKVAKNLSEGEKTAIAFVYFVVHLKDQNFDIKDGIIVIDDPVSSLDSNSLFQAFAFLKNSVTNAKQVFLFTHNFEFLRLLLNWLNFFNRDKKNKQPYFMIYNKIDIDTDERVATIKKLDSLLVNHESEYHYLCKLLFECESDGTIAKIYHIPNVARKVLETFLMFRVPNNNKIYEKLKSLDFDENKKTAIYKFTNDQSHITGKGFDPSLVMETQKNVKYLLEMMENVFPEHFTILKASI
ncbi:MAG: hypothetical protein A2X78_00095 [Gammaproteobacteria bacterium GWE2_37_16]|nr:MAG: hypothetical protein A2X78_00095 [Gammaproteobacteria bacterium GWE2_37_16]